MECEIILSSLFPSSPHSSTRLNAQQWQDGKEENMGMGSMGQNMDMDVTVRKVRKDGTNTAEALVKVS